VSVAAARALGGVGAVAAVGPLHDTAEQRGELRRAARQATAEIQSRLTGAAPGQLSLAGGEAGALSLADGEPGRLSLAERQAVDLSSRSTVTESGTAARPPRPAGGIIES
jgi:hypothetical protein